MYMMSIPDHSKVSELISKYGLRGKLEPLEKKLYQASVVESKFVPGNLVTMNSQLILRNVATGESHSLSLVYEQSKKPGQVSVLAPLGTALLAARENATISYKDKDVFRMIVIEKILFQPEASGRMDL